MVFFKAGGGSEGSKKNKLLFWGPKKGKKWHKMSKFHFFSPKEIKLHILPRLDTHCVSIVTPAQPIEGEKCSWRNQGHHWGSVHLAKQTESDNDYKS